MNRLLLSGAVVTVLLASACGADNTEGNATPQSTSESSPPTTSAPVETVTEEPTTEGPGAFGDRCSKFTDAADEIAGGIGDFIVDPQAPFTQPLEPDDDDPYEEAIRCVLAPADADPQNLTFVGVTEKQYADEESASLEPLREEGADDPSAFSLEDQDLGDDSLSYTYLVISPIGTAATYNLFIREGDRVTLLNIREVPDEPLTPGQEPPEQEADRHAALLELAELLGPWAASD